MEWILYSNIGGLYLSRKDSSSNPFGMTQVSLSLSIYIYMGQVLLVGLLRLQSKEAA